MTRIDFDMGIMQTGLSVTVEKVGVVRRKVNLVFEEDGMGWWFVFRRMKCVHTKDWSHWVRKP